MELAYQTPPEWADVALRNFDAFLLDHASCERKASSVGMSFVVRYPDRGPLLEPMINFAREELEHFHQVFKLIQRRGLILPPDEEDQYVRILMGEVRFGRQERFLDRLLVSGIIEARGAERLGLIAEKLTDPELKHFYQRLATAESHHRDLFERLAREFFSATVVNQRLQEFTDIEARAIASVPFRSALH